MSYFICYRLINNECDPYFLSSYLEVWSVSYSSIYENSESKVFQIIKCLGEISNNGPKHLLRTNIYKTLEFCWQLLLKILQWLQWANPTLVISKQGAFSPFSSFYLTLSTSK